MKTYDTAWAPWGLRPSGRWSWLCRLVLVLLGLVLTREGVSGAAALRLLTPDGYVAGLPVLARVEVIGVEGRRERLVWDAEVTLESPTAGATLSTNLVLLRNGLGSTLVSWTGVTADPVELVARWSGLEARRVLVPLGAVPTDGVSGTLPGSATTWSGLVRVTNDVTVPSGHVLTVEAGTWVLLQGVASGTNGADLRVNGQIQVRGTAERPVVFACAEPGLRWGQIRHSGGQPSVYRHAMIFLGGRAPGEGHTGTAPVLRTSNAQVTFDGCSLTDFATPAGTPGKIMQSSGSTLVMTNCLLSRARMGPEIGSTALQFLDSAIIDMRGPDDADGIYLHSQGAGQVIRLAGSVVAGGDDDGIDTLGATISVEDCIVRGWRFPGDDSKGISVFGGEVRVSRSLIVDNTIGLSGKGGNNENVRVRIDRCTILGNSYGVAVTNKSGTTPIIDYRITNSIILAPDAIFTQYDPGDIRIGYSLVGEPWSGEGVLEGDPGFVDVARPDLRLAPGSVAIDAGDPAGSGDPDGSRVDLGALTFVPPAPVWSVAGSGGEAGGSEFRLSAYPGRNYVIESSTGLGTWSAWRTVWATNDVTVVPGVVDSSAAGHRFYRARLAP